MNTGVVAYRYGKALLKYVQERGTGEIVYRQVLSLVQRMSSYEQLKHILENRDDVPQQQKKELMAAAVEETLAPELASFADLVHSQGRMNFLFRMLNSFITQYREANGIIVGRLTTAVPVEGLKEKLEKIFSGRTGASVRLVEDVDEDIIGGFVLELDGCRLDASVEGRLRKIRDELIEKNNRIV